MSLYKIVRSKGYKNAMAKLYGIGASIVILGALFKILHLNGADEMLMVGMGTEAIIFFFSAFEPLHKEYDWALVYPELQETVQAPKHHKGTVTQQLDRMLEEAKIGPDLIENLASGMRNLSDNAKKLSQTTDAAVATEGYVSNLSKAKDAVQNLTGVYEKSADALSSTSNLQVKSIQEMFEMQKQHAQKLQDTQIQGVQKLQETQMHGVQKMEQIQEQGNQTLIENYKKLGQIQDHGNQSMIENYKKLGQIHDQGNQSIIDSYTKLEHIQDQGNQSIIDNYKKLGQIQDQGHQTIIENYKKLQESAATLVSSMNESVQEAQNYKQEVDKLSKNVAQINAIYANMLAAMTNK
ncbi:MAG: gliding motility protein GldL [Lentimicrobiaceae bacterium]|nr:gliding motility protein GldL [Lentimicrobiaceae bacterium]